MLRKHESARLGTQEPDRPTVGKRGAVSTIIAPSSPLTAADRCDRCGAQAYVRVRLLAGGELLFCAHHAKKFDAGLKKVAVEIIDESERLSAMAGPTDAR